MRVRDPDVLARAAVIIGSCVPDDGINRNMSHLWSDGSHWWQQFSHAADCIAAAGGGCDALRACLAWNLVSASGSCASCNRDVASRCGEGLRLNLDCARLGLECDERAVCSAEPATTCDPTRFEMHCADDDVPEYCSGGIVYRGANCPALGLQCSGGDCAGDGEPCQTSARLSNGDMHWDGMGCADSSTLRACVGGRVATRACEDEAPGFTCQTFEGAYFCGLAAECLPGELPELDQRGTPVTCDGGTIVFCNAGRVERVACADLGFDDCGPTTSSCIPAIASIPN